MNMPCSMQLTALLPYVRVGMVAEGLWLGQCGNSPALAYRDEDEIVVLSLDGENDEQSKRQARSA
jgi:hypothetical protein